MRVILNVLWLSFATSAHGSTFLRQRQEVNEDASRRNQGMQPSPEDGTYWERLLQNEASSMPATPQPPPLNGDGSVGDDCFTNDDCKQQSCVLDPPNPENIGRCSCNPDLEETGCDGGYFCATPNEIGLAAGELISVAPFCKVPVGAPCDSSILPSDCLTTVCDTATGLCACNPNTNWPCDVSSGELCLDDTPNGFICKNPGTSDGDGSIGSQCFGNAECSTGTCFFGVAPLGDPGVCTCNPTTNDGCEGEFVCYDSQDLVDIVGVFDLPHECYLPHGAPCDGRAPVSGSCVTGNCANVTGQCTCNDDTSWPCNRENGEQCLVDEEGSFACIVPQVGNGPLGSECNGNNECDSGSCYRDPQIPEDFPGFCVCDTESNAGCEGNFKCATPGEILDAQLIADASPECYLLFGATCDDSGSCLTGYCNDNVCVCNPNTFYPCSVENGEACLRDSDGGFSCGTPDLGDGSIKSSCIDESNCNSGLVCYYGFIPEGTLGRCSCNAQSGFGCDEATSCYSPQEIVETYGITDQPPDCYLPFGASCSLDSGALCITGRCDKNTNVCACSSITNSPCDDGEVCAEDENGSFSCSPDPSLEPQTTCPEPNSDVVCTDEFDPVVCKGDCKYSNQCVATSANSTFTSETCQPDCPEFDGFCTQEFAPVECNGCEYSNQCEATGAGFAKEMCTPVPL